MDETVIIFKAFYEKEDLPYFFKHANSGSRKVPLDEWIEADRKPVRDGSGDHYYLSSFHVMTESSRLMDWCDSLRRTEGKVFIRVLARGIKRKKNSKFGMFLADSIKVPSSYWEKRISVSEFREKHKR